MERIKVKVTVGSPTEKVWELWSGAEHIVQWNTPSEDWHTVRAENDLRPGGKFLSRMEAKDGSFGFDFSGTYDEVVPNEHIAYTMDDGREVTVDFEGNNGTTDIITIFDPEGENPIEMQRDGWQAILDSFKRYAENH